VIRIAPPASRLIGSDVTEKLHLQKLTVAVRTRKFFAAAFEQTERIARLITRVGGRLMDERRIARWFGLVIGGIFTCGLVLNALAF
jgi:hypothetical protein